MLKNLSKKTKIIILTVHIISVIIVALIIGRLIWVGNNVTRELSYTYTKNIGEAYEYMNNITETLEKAKYVNTPTGKLAVASNLKQYSQGAKTAINNLPFSAENSEKLDESLSIISDFSYYIERKISAGESLSTKDETNFKTLGEHCFNIQIQLGTVTEKLGTGDMSIDKTQNIIYQSLNLPTAPNFDSKMGNLTEKLSILPAVEYDGVFTQHTEQPEPLFLKDKKEISKEDAIKKASEFLQIDTDKLTVKYESTGTIGEYQIISDDSTVNVTKFGGEISYFKKTMSIKESKLQYEDALQKAKEYLNKAGYDNIKETSNIVNDNICTINFVTVQDNVLLYPDLLTISIELGEGGMMEFSSKGFLMNNTVRANLVPDITEEQAIANIKENLEIKSTNLAIIPTAGQKEVLTYEFNLMDKDTSQKLIIYINAKTGFEEQIYLLYD